jgi:CHRD domain
MRRLLIGFVALGLCVLGLGAMWMVRADEDDVKFGAKLDGFQEVGGLNAETGAILSEGKGTLELTLKKNPPQLSYALSYSFPATTTVLQSHIHFGRVHTPGGIMVFLCTNLGNGPAGTPACPTPAATSVTGTITAEDVQAIAGQQVSAGDFDALTDALFSNSAYVNIHTTAFKAGEIRGQVRLVRHRGDRDRK